MSDDWSLFAAREKYAEKRCRMCGAPVRDGLLYCSGMSDCLKKGIGIMSETNGKPENDPVNHPSHYTSGGVETIVAIEAWGLGFNLGNAVKYISRAGKKDPTKIVEDLKKAEFYLKREIAKLTGTIGK